MSVGEDPPLPPGDDAAANPPFAMVAIASSAGGVLALRELVCGLPGGFAVPVLVVQHLDRRHATVLAEVVGAHARLPVRLAVDGERARGGTVYVAPPDYHLLVGPDGVLTLTQTELVHFVRPSADLLFESVAAGYGRRALACVLTGTGQDGAKGVGAVHSRGGTVIVQDPASAAFPGMPQAAIDAGAADLVLPLPEIAGALADLVGGAGRR